MVDFGTPSPAVSASRPIARPPAPVRSSATPSSRQPTSTPPWRSPRRTRTWTCPVAARSRFTKRRPYRHV